MLMLMSLNISKASHWNASFYNSIFPWPKYMPWPTEKKNFNDFLQSIVISYILLCSVGTVHLEGKVTISYWLVLNMMSFEEKQF